MFNLERREKFILIFLLVTLLAGLCFKVYQKSNRIVDVKVKGFNYEPSYEASIKTDINGADEAALAMLKGVGPALAKRIVDYRSKNGNFRSVEELKKVKGIGDKLFEKIKDEVSIE